jgi:hypothetical protein
MAVVPVMVVAVVVVVMMAVVVMAMVVMAMMTAAVAAAGRRVARGGEGRNRQRDSGDSGSEDSTLHFRLLLV